MSYQSGGVTAPPPLRGHKSESGETMEEIRAERESRPNASTATNKKEQRLAYEIALGIWLGGVALLMTSAVIGSLIMLIAAQSLKVHFG